MKIRTRWYVSNVQIPLRRGAALWGILFLLILSGPPLWANEKKDAQTQLSTEQLLDLLLKHQTLILDTTSNEKGCKSALTNPKKNSLGDYLAFLTASMDPRNGQSGVSSNCKYIKKDSIRQCEVMFSTGLGTEDPWSYGIRFNLDKRELDPKSLTCPGGS